MKRTLTAVLVSTLCSNPASSLSSHYPMHELPLKSTSVIGYLQINSSTITLTNTYLIVQTKDPKKGNPIEIRKDVSGLLTDGVSSWCADLSRAYLVTKNGKLNIVPYHSDEANTYELNSKTQTSSIWSNGTVVLVSTSNSLFIAHINSDGSVNLKQRFFGNLPDSEFRYSNNVVSFGNIKIRIKNGKAELR